RLLRRRGPRTPDGHHRRLARLPGRPEPFMNRPGRKQPPPPRAVTPLYAVPPTLEARPWRVVLVVPPMVPRWLIEFRDLAARHGWLDLAVLPAPGPGPGTAPGANAGLRLALAWERLLHRGDASGL